MGAQGDWWRLYPAVRQQVTARQVGPDKVVLNLSSGTFVTLNEVGAFLWDRIDGRRDLQAILDELLAEYEVDEPTARADVGRIVEELRKEGLVELRDRPSAGPPAAGPGPG